MTRTSDPEGSKHGTQRVYLVAETKGGTNGQAVTRPSERAKIDCAKVYFGEISKGVPGLRIRSAKRIPIKIKQYAAEKTSRFSPLFSDVSTFPLGTKEKPNPGQGIRIPSKEDLDSRL